MQRITSFSISDNEVMAFLAQQESQDIHSAEHWRGELIHRLESPIETTGIKMPWPKTHDKLRLRPSEVSIWFGRTGSFKSTTINQVALYATDEARVGIMSFEMPVDVTLERITKAAAGTPNPPSEYAHRMLDYLSDKMWIYDHNDLVAPERALACVHHMASLGIKLVILDCLIMVKGITRDADKEAEFMGHLTALAKIHDIHIALVHHPRKGDTRQAPDRWLTKDDLRGASDLGDMASVIVIVHHNDRKTLALEKQAHSKPLDDDDRKAMDLPCQTLIVDKNRNAAFKGPIGLHMNRDAMQFTESPNHKLHLPIPSVRSAA